MNPTFYVLASLIFSIEFTFLMDFLLNARNKHLKPTSVLALSILCFLLTLFSFRNIPVLPPIFSICLPVVVLLILAVHFLRTQAVLRHLHYACDDQGKNKLYAGNKVMLIVPHQDDDMNIASGILEQYVKYRSDVFVVFITNGDYWNIAGIRLTEALQALKSIGIPEDHVIFLGYADGWNDKSVHIYNAAPGKLCKSRNGRTSTYALKSHPAWNEGHPYTSDNLLEDIQSVILKHRPDIILCSDYDPHIEHKATTLAFEKVMGRILKQEPSYRPVVLKAFAYCTAWTALKDFPAINLLSTYDPGEQLPKIYQWSDRIRFPVDGSKLSRSLLKSELYQPISLYKSQRAGIAAGAIINGDKVFWQRRTDSLLLNAQIDVSSGNAEKLNNFMLLDSHDLWNCDCQPYDGVWLPNKDDHRKSIHVSLAAPSDITELVLYDAPSPTDNVLNARVMFDNGYCFDTGPLNPCGSASSFLVNQKGIGSFTIELLDTEGDCPGLTEIEAFDHAYSAPFSYIKLKNLDDHFVYDYIMDESGTEALQLYTFGSASPLSAQAYQVTCDNPDCSAFISEDKLLLNCPRGLECSITITSNADKSMSDSIYVRNPIQRERNKIIYAQRMEEFFHRRATYIWKQTALYFFSSNTRKYIHSLLRKCKHFLLSRKRK